MIMFGTDGWRGIIADDFTFANVRLVAKAVAEYVTECGEAHKGVVVGYDARFLSRRFAEECAAVLAANGIRVWLSDSILPTPALSWQVKDRQASGGIMITASHNPPEYNGLKYKAPYGGAASPEIIAQLEKHVRRLESAGQAAAGALPDAAVERFSPLKDYLAHIQAFLDAKILSGYRKTVIFDVMHGAAAGYPSAIAEEYGLKLMEIRSEYNPSFGGVNPEPIEKNLAQLRQAVLEAGAVFGLVTDGDGDRIGAMDRAGRFINAHEIIALLTRYLVEKRGWSGTVVQSLSLSEFVKRIASKYQLKLHETPVGFKHITSLMLTEDILIGGEEGGGIGIKNYIPERDGLVIGFLLIEMAAAYDRPLGELLAEMENEVGRFGYGRRDMHLDSEHKVRLMEQLANNPPRELGPRKVLSCRCSDGCKLQLEDGWVIFRASGTEPLVRVYAEKAGEENIQQLLEEAVQYAKSI